MSPLSLDRRTHPPQTIVSGEIRPKNGPKLQPLVITPRADPMPVYVGGICSKTPMHTIDLRKRAVSAYEIGLGSYERVAKVFGIGSASLKRWVCRSRERGDVAPEPHAGGTTPLIDEHGLMSLKALCESSPDASLAELCYAYNRRRKRKVSESTIGRAVRVRLGLARKKKAIGRSNRMLPLYRSSDACS